MVADKQSQIIDSIASGKANGPSLGAKADRFYALAAIDHMGIGKNVSAAGNIKSAT